MPVGYQVPLAEVPVPVPRGWLHAAPPRIFRIPIFLEADHAEELSHWEDEVDLVVALRVVLCWMMVSFGARTVLGLSCSSVTSGGHSRDVTGRPRMRLLHAGGLGGDSKRADGTGLGESKADGADPYSLARGATDITLKSLASC